VGGRCTADPRFSRTDVEFHYFTWNDSIVQNMVVNGTRVVSTYYPAGLPPARRVRDSEMDIISPPALMFLVFIIAGLIGASTRGLSVRQRVACVIVSLVIPVIGGLGVVAYVVSKQWRRSRSQPHVAPGVEQ
jgi:hypothetical protein